MLKLLLAANGIPPNIIPFPLDSVGLSSMYVGSMAADAAQSKAESTLSMFGRSPEDSSVAAASYDENAVELGLQELYGFISSQELEKGEREHESQLGGQAHGADKGEHP